MKYSGEYTQLVSFPLGGIGSGCVGLGGNGRLIDWEIFNHASKGSVNGCSHFAVRALKDGKILDARILNGDLYGNYIGRTDEPFSGSGPENQSMAGFPHFINCEFEGNFPFADIAFSDPHFPAQVKLTAFNPFIPLNDADSSIPAAFFEIEINNTTDSELEYGVCFSVANPAENSVNNALDNGKGVLLSGGGELCFETDCENASIQLYRYRGSWNDAPETFWREMTEKPVLPPRNYDTPGKFDTAAVEARVFVKPGGRRTVRFVLSWYYPEVSRTWRVLSMAKGDIPWDTKWRNYYAKLFSGAADCAAYCLKNWDRLCGESMKFLKALSDSTLPPEVLEAISATLSVLKSPTVLRLENGEFYGWEGVNSKTGSCEGSCTHVWNYAYALPFLFPKLERSVRDLDYRYNMLPTGEMQFRLMLPLGNIHMFRACVDGQFGGVIKVWRDWKLCGDDNWLRELWPKVKKSLEYAWSPENRDRWDLNKDGMLEGRQHHTLDMELFGPSSWLQGFYLAALKAGAEMAEYLGEPEKAKEYLAVYESGRKKTEELFNGKYYQQKIDLHDEHILDPYPDAREKYWNGEAGQIKYQIGDGCEIDQLLGQWHADICGLGELFNPENRQTALENLYHNNFKNSVREFYNPFRLYTLNDEGGTIICTYPEGAEKPAIPIPYCQETMHGFEYAAAGLMYKHGLKEQALEMVRSVREKYDGKKRNPYNEIECGNNYARSMATYAFIPLISGFSFNMSQGMIGFEPIDELPEFRCIWSVDSAWGTVRITEQELEIIILGGELRLKKLRTKLAGGKGIADGKTVSSVYRDGEFMFAEPVTVREKLTINK